MRAGIMRLTKRSAVSLAFGRHRSFHATSSAKKIPCSPYNEPTSSAQLPRSGGIASMMRLPVQKTTEGMKHHVRLGKGSLRLDSADDCQTVWNVRRDKMLIIRTQDDHGMNGKV